MGMHSEGGIHGGHGGHHDVHAWEAPPETQVEGDVKQGATIHVKQHKATEANHADTLDQTGEVQTTGGHLRALDRKATGAGYATLSQNELDSLQTGDPIIYGHKGVSRNAPPAGPGGTGNPFFNPNPMVMFLTCFFKVMQVMKWLELVAAKLAVNALKITREAGKDQSRATLEAGKAAYRAGVGQAITSFAQAGLGAATTVMSVFSFFKAKSMFKNELITKEKKMDQAEKTAKKTTDLNNEQMKSLQSGIRGKSNILTRNGHLPPPESKQPKFTLEKGPQHSAAGQRAQKNAKAELEAERKNQLSMEKMKKVSPLEATPSEIESAQRKWNSYKKEGLDQFKDEAKANEYANNRMEKGLQKDKAKLAKLEKENLQAKSEYKQAKHEYRAYERGGPKHIGEMMTQDPKYQMFQAGAGAATHGLQGLGQYFKARGDLEQAQQNAIAQLDGMYVQIDFKNVDSTMQMGQDAYQQASEIPQTWTKMSDQEQSSMHWAG